ncbi:FAD binding domain-containing protein [Methylacidiphilum kamchatkense Kam1]|uniref:FAD binding domain-containing protein n=1 Tax=Methylacidiphilum kamchatkense Kam1 TaxID=1202785 RepID=A0A516TP45_9BACT|nr:FAD-binding protein [Methylacidiphilum kamchatkense]QDQ43009.1 FAD binding domain-containing protein [Methylacidiphilum kamchatkense Kam1]
MQISAVAHGRDVEFPVPDARIPSGPLSQKWQKLQRSISLVSPNNRPKYRIIVVGTGLAGSAAASALGELGYNVESFCIQDSPRRAHSVAAQGGINAAKNYRNDGDSVYRLFYETIKGGILEPEKPMFIVWLKSVRRSSIIV